MYKQLTLLNLFFLCFLFANAQEKLFVAVNGRDENNGSIEKPFKTLQAAINASAKLDNKKVIIEMRGGVYYPDATVIISSATTAALHIRAYRGEKVVISGAHPYKGDWHPYKNGIFKAKLALPVSPDRIFWNGKALSMARYPNYDSAARVFNGTAPDAISNDRVKYWSNPTGAYVHALHKGEWGGLHYVVTGKNDAGNLLLEGGWQNNRPSPMHYKYRFVENVFEELDAAGEWFYDKTNQTLYVYPPKGKQVQRAEIAIGHLKELIVLKGSIDHPVKHVSIEGIQFVATDRSFMLTKESLLRSDWTIYRGAAVLMEGTEDCSISNCVFTEIGGNAILLSNYNKNDLIKDNHIFNIGATAIAFVGNPSAVRSPAFGYDAFVPWDQMDYTPGPQNKDYPQQCIAEGNLIHSTGLIEKQSAGVEIYMAANITARFNSIYSVPRAGINIGDGCWGGHVLEFNEVFNTVKETGDHGAFNSWGRDRFWRPERNIIDSIVAARPGIELLDIVEPNIIRNNRFQCSHGWDIDLDDGSGNYLIYNNICLSGGLKLREGYHRKVYNNIIINNSFHPHVWLKNSGDVFVHNIVTTAYAPILMDNWGKQIDSNFFLSQKGLQDAIKDGTDKSSMAGDPMFVDATRGNYTLKPGSPAMQTGFVNVDMNTGVQLPALKKIALRAPIQPLIAETIKSTSSSIAWLGATVKSIETLGEQSAAGLADKRGVLLLEVAAGSVAFKNGLQKADVITMFNGQAVGSAVELWQLSEKVKWMGTFELQLVRNQSVITKTIKLNQ